MWSPPPNLRSDRLANVALCSKAGLNRLRRARKHHGRHNKVAPYQVEKVVASELPWFVGETQSAVGFFVFGRRKSQWHSGRYHATAAAVASPNFKRPRSEFCAIYHSRLWSSNAPFCHIFFLASYKLHGFGSLVCSWCSHFLLWSGRFLGRLFRLPPPPLRNSNRTFVFYALPILLKISP